MKSFSLIFALLVFGQPGCFAAETIVGTWAHSTSGCKTEPITIKPMEIQGGDVFCYFNNVSRAGERVTWTGHCFADGGSRRPEAGEDGEVSAFYRNGKLQIEGLGLVFTDLMRCK